MIKIYFPKTLRWKSLYNFEETCRFADEAKIDTMNEHVYVKSDEHKPKRDEIFTSLSFLTKNVLMDDCVLTKSIRLTERETIVCLYLRKSVVHLRIGSRMKDEGRLVNKDL